MNSSPLAEPTGSADRIIGHWIDGAAKAGASGDRSAPVFNPAEGVVSARVSLATASTVDAVVQTCLLSWPSSEISRGRLRRSTMVSLWRTCWSAAG